MKRPFAVVAIISLGSLITSWAWGTFVIGSDQPSPFWWTYWLMASTVTFGVGAFGWVLSPDQEPAFRVGNTEWPSFNAWLEDMIFCVTLHRHDWNDDDSCRRCGTCKDQP